MSIGVMGPTESVAKWRHGGALCHLPSPRGTVDATAIFGKMSARRRPGVPGGWCLAR